MRTMGLKRIGLLLGCIILTGCGANAEKEETGMETVQEDGIQLSDDASDFVLITDAVPDAILEIRYYSTDNFV